MRSCTLQETKQECRCHYFVNLSSLETAKKPKFCSTGSNANLWKPAASSRSIQWRMCSTRCIIIIQVTCESRWHQYIITSRLLNVQIMLCFCKRPVILMYVRTNVSLYILILFIIFIRIISCKIRKSITTPVCTWSSPHRYTRSRRQIIEYMT